MPTSNKPAKPARKLSGKAIAAKAAKPATAPVKPAAAPVAAKPVTDERMHGFGTSYTGASPAIRMHGRKLSPIVLDRIPNSYTDRDHALLKSLYEHFKQAAFQRRDIDAGALSRLIGHGAVKHVAGALDQREATFSITDTAVKQRLSSAKAAAK